MSELHLFIIWKNALNKKQVILDDIKKHFEIIEVYEVLWSNKEYSNNLSRFYGTSLPDGSYKEEHCGKGTFLLIIVKDNMPKYDNRMTSRGMELVNINMFDRKTYYRNITGGGHRIHATNSLSETNHDLTLLIGKNVNDYLFEHQFSWNGKEKHINSDLVGSNGFDSVSEMFYVLNNCTNYAILRNYETLPDEIYVNEHNDIDLICESRENVAYALNATKAQEEDYRVQYHVKVKGRQANFDLRYIGDKYYDCDLEKAMLQHRIYNDKGFYTLSEEYYFYTLLYHAVIHKRIFSNDYIKKLDELNIDIEEFNLKGLINQLDTWMIKNKYIIEKPNDSSVYFNLDNLKYVSKLIYRNNEKEIELGNQVKYLTDKLNAITYSRTWRYTEFIRKINCKIKQINLKINIKNNLKNIFNEKKQYNDV